MADDESPEETPAAAPESNDGEISEPPEQNAAFDETGESVAPSVEAPVDQKEHLTPHRAAKLAGIGVLAALLVAVIVVATVWAVSAITDESDDDGEHEYDDGYYERRDSDDGYYERRDSDDYEDYERRGSDDDDYYERRGSDDGWLQCVEPSELADHLDGFWRDQPYGPFDYDQQWDKRWEWAEKDYFAKPCSSSECDVWGRTFGFGAGSGPVVVVVLGGPGGWGYAGGFGSPGPGFGAGAALPDLLPFAEGDGYFGGLGPGLLAELFALDLFDDPSVLEGLFGEWDIEVPDLPEESSLGVTELDNLAPLAVEEFTPT